MMIEWASLLLFALWTELFKFIAFYGVELFSPLVR
jgi:hypothetical protein